MLPHDDLPRRMDSDVRIIGANSASASVGWTQYTVRPGVSFLYIFLLAGGGGGGNGVVGANSTAAGGGGGGSSSQTSLLIPAHLLPSTFFVSVGYGGGINGAGIVSRVSVDASATANNTIAIANGGGAGGNASGATAGAAGAVGAVATVATMPLCGLGTQQLIAGNLGIIGGTTVSGAALTIPVTGLVVTGGTGGGGLPAAAVAGTNGGSFTVAGTYLPVHTGGVGGAAATTPGGNGWNGPEMVRALRYSYGGTGGGSSHGSATGAGLVGGVGGKGGIGCGGGGGGGALTGSTQGTGGFGGPGICIITAW